MALHRFVVVDNADVGALGYNVHIAEVFAVGDVGEEEEVWIDSLIDDPEPAGAKPCNG